MKKAAAVIVALALALSFGSVAMAAPVCTNHFTDANGDGLCDTCGEACYYTDANGDGLCDYCSADCQYVDEDGGGGCWK